MADDGEERIVLKDGRIVLYKRTNLKNPKWQARISVPNATGYKIVSTRHADQREAERFALNLYEDLYIQIKAGGQLQSRTFKQVYEEWKRQAGEARTRNNGSWDTTIARIEEYALGHFGPKRIETIKGSDFTEYWLWRKVNFRKKMPSSATLKRECTCIMPVFKYALSKGYIVSIPETHVPKSKSERRPTFTLEEWRTIRDASVAWVNEGRGLATWRDRFMAQHCFLLLANTGLRIGELRKLRWRDLISVSRRGKERAYLAGHASGKTGPRQFIFQPGSEVSVKAIYVLRCREIEDSNPLLENPRPDPEEPILCHRDGRAIVQYKNAFHSLLDFAGIPSKIDGKSRTIYSLRHFYATRQLSKETSAYLLARQMGTSVEMLEKHYGQVINTSLAREITGSKPSDIIYKGHIEFPF